MKLCLQANILTIVSSLTVLASLLLGGKLHAVGGLAAVAGLFAYGIQMLCDSGNETAAWAATFFPTVIYFSLFMILLSIAVKKMTGENKKDDEDDKDDDENKKEPKPSTPKKESFAPY